jgi:hypothetical protein
MPLAHRREDAHGLALLIAADVVLAWAPSPLLVCAGAALWGLHMAWTQGLLAKLVADTAPTALRGTSFGIFNLVSGAALLCASVMAGSLWNACGASATFLAGAVFASRGGDGASLHNVPRSPSLCARPPASDGGAEPLWAAPPHLLSGR